MKDLVFGDAIGRPRFDQDIEFRWAGLYEQESCAVMMRSNMNNAPIGE